MVADTGMQNSSHTKKSISQEFHIKNVSSIVTRCVHEHHIVVLSLINIGNKFLQGFKKVFNIAGGIHAYAVKADPSIPTY